MDIDQIVAANPEKFTGLYRIGEPRRSSITFQEENVEAMRREGFPLLEKHYDEIAQFKEVQVLDPDWEAYDRMEKAGKLWVMTVRDGACLIGYIVMFIGYDLHYRRMLRATEDVHFLLPEYRKGMLGFRMLARMKKEMQAKGVHTITLRTKANNDHAVLFERLGGVLHDKVYTIVL
jgi:Acetyltransferase (GNAT) family